MNEQDKIKETLDATNELRDDAINLRDIVQQAIDTVEHNKGMYEPNPFYEPPNEEKSK